MTHQLGSVAPRPVHYGIHRRTIQANPRPPEHDSEGQLRHRELTYIQQELGRFKPVPWQKGNAADRDARDHGRTSPTTLRAPLNVLQNALSLGVGMEGY
eukprot:6019061-Pyramimonas_sp.AAC.1